MHITHRKSITPIIDACGILQEMYTSENLSISYSTIEKDTIPHKHKILEEVYVILKWRAKIVIGNEVFEISSGDTFGIPKDTYHYITEIEESIELIVVTHPKFIQNDLIYISSEE